MSKRLQITLSDDGYEKLLQIMDSIRCKNKSTVIDLSVETLFKYFKEHGVITEK